MSEGPVEQPVVDQGFGLMPQDDNQQQTSNTPQPEPEKINPAWSGLLEEIPTGLHGILTPHLKKWDENYQQGLQKVHSQYEPYKPFIEQGLDPEALNNALLVQQSLEQDPQRFVEAVIEYYKLQLGEQGQSTVQDPQEQEEDPVFDITQHPEFQRVTGLTETMAKALLAQNEQAEAAQAEADLDREFEEAKEKYGEFDEEYVAQYAYVNGVDIDTAVQKYQEFAQRTIQNYRPPGANAPVLMGGGGGLPSQATPVGKMNGQQRRALIVQTLNNLRAQGG